MLTKDFASRLLESMVKGFARIRDFKEVNSFKYFVFRVAKNAAIDYTRTREVRNTHNIDIENHAAETPADFDRHYIYSHALNVIYQEIAQLPLQVREVITRNLVNGQSLAEIAAQMNLAYKTVHNHRARGLLQLRLAVLKKGFLDQPMLFAACKLLLFLAEKK